MLTIKNEKAIKNLIKDMVDLFQKRKEKKKMGKRIFRGRAAAASSDFENRVAQFLDRLLPKTKKYKILVDYPMTYRNKDNKDIVFFPDIAIIKEDILIGIIELKIDIGYFRDNWITDYKSKFKELRKAKELKYNSNVGRSKTDQEKLYITQRNVKMMFIILTAKNDHKRLPQIKKAFTNCYVLSNNIHPNDFKIDKKNKEAYLKEIFASIENKKNWDKLVEFIKRNFK